MTDSTVVDPPSVGAREDVVSIRTPVTLSADDRQWVIESGLADVVAELSGQLVAHQPIRFRQYIIDFLKEKKAHEQQQVQQQQQQHLSVAVHNE